MIKAIIIEDEISAQNQLNQLITRNYSEKIEIIGTCTSVKKGIEIINSLNPQLIFLDIQLDDGEGFEILDNVDNSNFEVIFTTGLRNSKEKAMDYFAFYYLNKPLLEDVFIKTINTFLEKKSSFDLEKYLAFKSQIDDNHKRISVPVKDGYEIINIDDIIYCEADGSYTTFYTTNNKKYVTSTILKKIETILKQASFFRIHRSALVNLKHITKFENSGKLILSNKKTLAVSHRNRKNFIHILKLMSYNIN
jgi:two-component system LytT family response regulator